MLYVLLQLLLHGLQAPTQSTGTSGVDEGSQQISCVQVPPVQSILPPLVL